jgi:para-aminobenzoate synthetase component I
MRPLIQEIVAACTPESLVENLRWSRRSEGKANGIVLLRTAAFDSPSARYSFVAASPLLTFRSFGSRCEISIPQRPDASPQLQFGNPWHILDALMARFELVDDIDLPFPLGGCFGFWGYDLKNFTEPKLPRRAVNDLELPDCCVGFYDSLVVFDHQLGKVFVVSTGLDAEGSRSELRAKERLEFWRAALISEGGVPRRPNQDADSRRSSLRSEISSNLSPDDFIAAVKRAQQYIRAGDIYQVNLSHRLTAELNWQGDAPDKPAFARQNNSAPARGGPSFAKSFGSAGARPDKHHFSGWNLFERLSAVSPAPFSAFLDCGDFQIASSSPEQFLRMSGSHIVTRPIKGTRPRDADPTRDAQLAYELQTSPKELAELLMITDLLRNDVGKICEFGSLRVPELARLERFAHVQHLVSTVEGRLRADVAHFAALASCFPGGSITGAPKFRAMEIIDELEPISRGPYCGAIGYLGFNRESQLSIAIRAAVCKDGLAHFNVGAGIVADSNPGAEYEETLAKALGFLDALEVAERRLEISTAQRSGKIAPK